MNSIHQSFRILFCTVTLLVSCRYSCISQIQVRDEPKHRPVLENKFIRILDVWIKGGDSCKFHLHNTPSLFVYLSSARVRTQVQGEQPVEQKVEPGQTWYNSFSDKPLVHRAWVRDVSSLHAIDIELLGELPFSLSEYLTASGLTLLQDSTRHRTYRFELPPSTRLQLQSKEYPVIIITYKGDGDISDPEGRSDLYQGQFHWMDKQGSLELKNKGEGRMEGYVYEIKQ